MAQARVTRNGRNEGVDELVGPFLERELGELAIVLHDLRLPGSRATIDHVVIAPSGVWVVDSTWRGELRLDAEVSAGTTSVDAIAGQVRVVATAVGRASDVPIRAALCFSGVHWNCVPGAFCLEGVLVTYPADLVARIRADGPLDEETMGWIAARLALDLES